MKKITILAILLILTSCGTDRNKNAIQANSELKNKKEIIEPVVNENIKKSLNGFIENKYPNSIKKQKILKAFGKELESLLDYEDYSKKDLKNFFRINNCMSFNLLGQDIPLIEMKVFDTEKKQQKYEDFNVYQSGKIFGGDLDLETLDCNF